MISFYFYDLFCLHGGCFSFFFFTQCENAEPTQLNTMYTKYGAKVVSLKANKYLLDDSITQRSSCMEIPVSCYLH